MFFIGYFIGTMIVYFVLSLYYNVKLLKVQLNLLRKKKLPANHLKAILLLCFIYTTLVYLIIQITPQ